MAIITVSLLNQPPKRFKRVWIKEEDFGNVRGFLDRMALKLNSVEWQCPCKATDIVAVPATGAHLVHFYLIKKDRPEMAVHVHSIEHFCAEVTKSPYFMGFNGTCNELLKESFRSSGWEYQILSSNANLYMTSLRTASLNPISFMPEVCMSWTGGLSQASSFYLISNYGLRKKKSKQLKIFLRTIKTSLDTCAKHKSWPPPNNSRYLAEAKRAGLDSAKFEYIVAINFNWTQYFTTCSPSYCDHMQSSSYIWLLFTAVAQIGGFVSISLFALRFAIWPLFCIICGWPSALNLCHDESKEAKNSDVQGGRMDCC
ncbi:hypothetical protein HHK36_028496 [Tetracentron sinense]|uniref:Uncharacterized protein n=1 Tax=Tetracentron sinense TaxID=13715 RepID=A0A834YD68_TETSI|nr:hypothetical protein HHK36_028496 [Tetracentron sinense]